VAPDTEAEMARAVADTRRQVAFYDRAAMGGLVDDDVLRAFAVVAEPGGVAAEAEPGGVAAEIQRRFGGLIDRVSFYSPYESGTETWDYILQDLKSPAGS
jgi:hypothetical protein